MPFEAKNVISANRESLLHFSGTAGVACKQLVDCPQLNLDRGTISVLMGPSGSGKTILCKTLAGLLPPMSGRVQKEPGILIRLLLQNTRGFPWRSMFENILLGVTLSGSEITKADREQATELISEIGLKGHENKRPAQLSGGMLRRMLIARSLMSAPHILILDEPFAGLDEVNRDIIREELKHLASTKGMTILVVTHQVADAVDLEAQIWLITDNATLVRWSPSDQKTGPSSRETTL